MLRKPVDIRWARAQKVDQARIKVLGQGYYEVPSLSSDHDPYKVYAIFNKAQQLKTAKCPCKDFNNPYFEGLGEPLHHGIRVCYHILAAGIKKTTLK